MRNTKRETEPKMVSDENAKIFAKSAYMITPTNTRVVYKNLVVVQAGLLKYVLHIITSGIKIAVSDDLLTLVCHNAWEMYSDQKVVWKNHLD